MARKKYKRSCYAIYNFLTDDPNATTVYMSFQQHLSWFPWERLGGMLHDEIIGPSMEAGLDKLKQVVEKT